MIPDYVKTAKDAMAIQWSVDRPEWDPVLEVDDLFDAALGRRALLLADDGGPALLEGAWLVGATPYRTVLRLTAFADGRTGARETAVAGADFVRIHRPGIARVESVSIPLITRDPETGAFLASITMPVIVKQTA